MDNGFENIVDADALLGAAQHGVARVDPDHGLNLLANAFGLGGRQVDFIDDGNNFEIVVQREVRIRQRLRFHALRRIHHQQCAFAGLQAAGNLIRKIDVPRRIDQVQLIHLPVVGAIVEANGVGFDGDAALAFEIHRVEDLLHHFPLGEGACHLEQTVGQGGLAVVDVRDDREITDEFAIHGVGGLA